MKKFTLLLSAMLLACATNLRAADSWVEVSIDQLTSSDVFLIVDANSGTAMTNSNGTTAAPAATIVFSDGVFDVSKVTDVMKWNLSGDATNGYVIYPNGDTKNWLYCTSTNNGVRVGTNEANTFKVAVDDTSSKAYLTHTGTNRWIGVYNSQDWRCYTTVNANIKATITKFYKLVSGDAPVDTLIALTITGTPDKTTYEVGETLDPTGLVVKGTYSEGDPKEITSGITWTFNPEVLADTTEEVKVVATVGTISSTEYVVPVTVTEHVVTPGTYSIDLNASLYGVSIGNNGTEQTVTKNDITIISGCTSSATSKTYYDAGHIRYYANSYLKLAVPTGYDITKVEYIADGTWNGEITPSVGTYNNDNKAWTGNAPDSLIFSFAKQNRVKTIVVTYEVHQEVLVAAPVLTAEAGKVAEGEFVQAFRLTMSCETEDATILYTLDGSDPTTSETVATYIAPITIIETTTVRAIAQKAELWSRETTETFTKIAALTTMDEIFATATEATSSNIITKYITFSDWIISGVINSNAYLTDGTKGLIIYTSTHGFEVGDVLNGTAACDITLFNGNAEIKGLKATNTGLTITKGGTAPVQTPSIAELSPINTGSLISLSNLTYNGSVLTDAADNTITPYGTFITLPTMTKGKQYNVKGVYIDYKGTKEIAPLAESDIQEVTTPSAIDNAVIETPVVKTIENGQLVIMRDGVKYNAMGVRL